MYLNRMKSLADRVNHFLLLANQKHGSKYQYKTEYYQNTQSIIPISCKIHGWFNQRCCTHLAGTGCPQCFRTRQRSTAFDFITKAVAVHGDKYDYSLVNYQSATHPVTIICKEHGPFDQIASTHLNGSGCPADFFTTTTINFVTKAKTIHGDRYDYSNAVYAHHATKLAITCPEHGVFWQRPSNHLKGAGCPLCAKVGCLLNRDCFLQRLVMKHGDEYDYSKVDYRGAFDYITIICKKHGEFSQSASNHLQGARCQECIRDEQRLTTDEFIINARAAHGDKYDYSKVVYSSACDKVTIICAHHGEFTQRPKNHVHLKAGCPNCNTVISSGHQRLLNEFDGDEIDVNTRRIIRPYEIDIYFPKHKVGIEYHGGFWHSDSLYRSVDKFKCLKKHQLAIDAGVKLFQLYEYEVDNLPLIRSMINHALGKSTRLYARHCNIAIPSELEAKEFFNSAHISGHRPATVYFGLIYNNKYVSMLSMSKHPKYQWEIIRFASAIDSMVVGGFSKLLKCFKRANKPISIFTYADKRFGDGNVYEQCDFIRIGSTKPNYRYIDFNKKVMMSRQQCQKHKLSKLLGSLFDEKLSESNNMLNAGYGKIWDAGHYRFLWSEKNGDNGTS